MKKGWTITILILGLLLLPSFSFAEGDYGSRIAIGAKAGTLGGGLEGAVKIVDNFNTRVGFNLFEFDYDGTESDVEYDFELKLLTFSALADWFPFSNNFRLSAGFMINENEINSSAKSSTDYTIGDTTYTANQVGTLKGNIGFNDIAPYIGIGYGNPFGDNGDWCLTFDLGVIYQGSPEVDLTADGLLASDASFTADIKKEEDDLQDDISGFKFYPVIAIGVTYHF